MTVAGPTDAHLSTAKPNLGGTTRYLAWSRLSALRQDHSLKGLSLKGVLGKAFSVATALIIAFTIILSGLITSSLDLNAQTKTGKTGLPLPRYVSLKSDKVNLRTGPGVEYPTTWVYRRAGLPLEVFEEFQNWRHVRDSEGTEGWIFSSLLSGRRTALVLPWERKKSASKPTTAVYNNNSLRARKVAIIEAGVIADVHRCDGRWCEVTINAFNGYIDQTKLWGVYPNESWK